GRIIDALRHERFRFKPVRRIYIPKKNRRTRPLGLPSWSDKLVGEVIRLLLEAYYEPQFSGRSHGFRPGRGCHTALREITDTWSGTNWFIEGDIADYFGSLDHSVMLGILGEKIHDGRFLGLLRNMLKAGYLEDWVWNATLSGAPQGGVVSPILSNIYLHRLDAFVETVLMPEYTRGEGRAVNPAYREVLNASRRARRRGDREQVRELSKQLRSLPSTDPRDPEYRRLKYVRYADDTLLGFAGPRAEAEQIKARLTTFLRDDLKLEMSQDKTLITHGRSEAASFLGYEIIVQHNDRKATKGKRSVNSGIALRVPLDVIKAKSAPYLKRGKPAERSWLVNEDDYTIVTTYGAEHRGIVQYYLLAGDVWRLTRLQWVMETSMLKTLAGKHRSTVSKMARRYAATIQTPVGPRKCFQAEVGSSRGKPLVARFGGIPLQRRKAAVLTDRQPYPTFRRGKELVTRLLTGVCEICGQQAESVEVHHIRKLADLDKGGASPPAWAELMARRRRKTLVVCLVCHGGIHVGQPAA
ncbi:MAG: reverse transcriptase domain-containing protein, partial [Dermatophilaceae bacterium]